MAVNGGPKIPKDGLVLSLDAANFKSFRGEPTTNLTRNARDFTGNAYGYGNEYASPLLNKTYISDLDTPVGKGATLISVDGSYGYHYLSSWGGGGEANYYLSCYVKPIDSGITDFTLGLIGDSGHRATFNLDTKQITIGSGLANQDVFIEEVVGWPGWLRIGADIEGRAGGWVGSIGYSQWFQYTGTDGYGSLYITGIQFETGSFTHFIDAQQSRGTTVATGGGWADITNNSNHGELINGTAYDSGSLGSLSFDGVNDYVDLGTSIVLNNECTFCIWFNSSNITQLKYLMCKANSTGYARDFYVGLVNSAKIDVWFGNSSTEYLFFSSPNGSYTINSWNNLVVTRDGSTCKIYINGVQKASASYSFTQNNNGHSFKIGNLDNSSSRLFSGKVSSAFVYNRALSQNEIKNIYEATRGRFGL